MVRYYFHVRKRGQLTRDEEGIDLPDISAAKQEALQGARELLAEAIKTGRPSVPDALVITDEAGHEVDTVPLQMLLPKPF
jgi:hypothetical protein